MAREPGSDPTFDRDVEVVKEVAAMDGCK
uniref:Uncharacterized protein n=1 Tax=Rhizophora mucronata TaxID=61149 RepID=A0A2P2IV47_RHIMU